MCVYERMYTYMYVCIDTDTNIDIDLLESLTGYGLTSPAMAAF